MKTMKMQITLPDVLAKKLNEYCQATGLKKSAAITNLLMLAFETLATKN